MSLIKRLLIYGAAFCGTTIYSVSVTSATREAPSQDYIQDFTAFTLKPQDMKLGLSFDYGMTEHLQVGTDLMSTIVGAPNVKLKFLVWESKQQQIAVGLHTTYLDRKTALWGDIIEVFDELDAKLIRPQISWSHRISSRLFIHSHWSIGIGNITAKLSPLGKRRYWERKYPKGNYDTGEKNVNSPSANQEANFGSSHRTLQAQALLGLSRDLFQVTGEFIRDDTKKILLTSRVDRTKLEQLSSQGLRVTVGQEWRVGRFNFRLGLGILYQVLSGTDLDGELVDDAGFMPIGDFDFYWIL